MFYCAAHDRIEDSDFVGYYVTNAGEEMCDVAADEMFNGDTDGASFDYFSQYDAAGDGWGNDDIMAMYDDDPNPYTGTYSED